MWCATTTTTPLFFAQAVGRFVRARRRGETASVFLPSTGHLLGLAAELELERDHVLGLSAPGFLVQTTAADGIARLHEQILRALEDVGQGRSHGVMATYLVNAVTHLDGLFFRIARGLPA